MKKEMTKLIQEITINAYGLRVVECKAWRWCIGSKIKAWEVADKPNDVAVENAEAEAAVEEKPYPLEKAYTFRLETIAKVPNNAIPDFSDRRTVGLLLFLVRMIYGDNEAIPEIDHDPNTDDNLRFSFKIKSTTKAKVNICVYGRSMIEVLVSAVELSDRLGYAD